MDDMQDPLDTIIRSLVEAIPDSCKTEYGSHEWEHAYGDREDTYSGCPQTVYDEIAAKYGKLSWRKAHKTPEYKAAWALYGNLITRSSQMLPYYVCKHCFAVSEPFTTTHYPKKAR